MARERKGSIVTRDNKIYARIQFKDDTGKKRDVWRKADNQKHAKEIIKQLLKETEDATARQLDGATMTLAELAEYYIKNYLHEAIYIGSKKISGVRGVEPALYAVKPLIAYFGNQKIKAITFGNIRTYKRIRLETLTKHGTQRSIAAVNKELSKLKRMLNIAVREQWLNRNPFDNGESLIGDEIHRNRILTMTEETRLFGAIEAKVQRAHLKGIVLIAVDCALRRGEIFKLCWRDVDLEKKTITVTAFNSKTARERFVAMTNRVYTELFNLWKNSDKNKDALVFGVSITIKTAWQKICREAKIENFRFHDLRHTAITRMIRAGLPPVEVMRVSGHATMSAFYRYVNADSESVFRAANLLDCYLTQGFEEKANGNASQADKSQPNEESFADNTENKESILDISIINKNTFAEPLEFFSEYVN